MVSKSMKEYEDKKKLDKEDQAISKPLEKITDQLQLLISTSRIQTDVFTQLLKQLELIICSLEKISKQTCESLNELHYQTDSQKTLQSSIEELLEMYRTTHPSAANEYIKLRELRKQIEICSHQKNQNQFVSIHLACRVNLLLEDQQNPARVLSNRIKSLGQNIHT